MSEEYSEDSWFSESDLSEEGWFSEKSFSDSKISEDVLTEETESPQDPRDNILDDPESCPDITVRLHGVTDPAVKLERHGARECQPRKDLLDFFLRDRRSAEELSWLLAPPGEQEELAATIQSCRQKAWIFPIFDSVHKGSSLLLLGRYVVLPGCLYESDNQSPQIRGIEAPPTGLEFVLTSLRGEYTLRVYDFTSRELLSETSRFSSGGILEYRGDLFLTPVKTNRGKKLLRISFRGNRLDLEKEKTEGVFIKDTSTTPHTMLRLCPGRQEDHIYNTLSRCGDLTGSEVEVLYSTNFHRGPPDCEDKLDDMEGIKRALTVIDHHGRIWLQNTNLLILAPDFQILCQAALCEDVYIFPAAGDENVILARVDGEERVYVLEYSEGVKN